MNAFQFAIAREAHRLAQKVLWGEPLSPEDRRGAELCFRSVLRFAEQDRRHRASLDLLLEIEDALAHLKAQNTPRVRGAYA
jgi:hypothetical protein